MGGGMISTLEEQSDADARCNKGVQVLVPVLALLQSLSLISASATNLAPARQRRKNERIPMLLIKK